MILKKQTAVLVCLMLGVAVLAGVLFAGPVSGPSGRLDPPPGAVGPTGRPIELVDPRTPVGSSIAGTSSGSQLIASPGSYYLTGDIVISANSTGITIQSGDVELDMNGYAVITDAEPGLSGINVTASGRVSIRNGRISGFENGINAPNARLTVEGVDIDDVANAGVVAGDELTLREVRVDRAGGVGIDAGNGMRARDVVVRDTEDNGIRAGDRAQVSHVRIENAFGFGLWLGDYALVENVTASVCRFSGVFAGAHAIVNDCIVLESDGGVLCAGSSLVTRTTVSNVSGEGIIPGDNSVVKECTIRGTGRAGIQGGFYANIVDCSVRQTLTGIETNSASRVAGTIVQNSLMDGIKMANTPGRPTGVVESTVVYDSGFDGINAGEGSLVRGVVAWGNEGDGVESLDATSLSHTVVGQNSENGVRIGDHAAVTGIVSAENLLFGFVPGFSPTSVGAGHAILGSSFGANGEGGVQAVGSLVGTSAYNNVDFGIGVERSAVLGATAIGTRTNDASQIGSAYNANQSAVLGSLGADYDVAFTTTGSFGFGNYALRGGYRAIGSGGMLDTSLVFGSGTSAGVRFGTRHVARNVMASSGEPSSFPFVDQFTPFALDAPVATSGGLVRGCYGFSSQLILNESDFISGGDVFRGIFYDFPVGRGIVDDNAHFNFPLQ